jgi:hypothetical protein
MKQKSPRQGMLHFRLNRRISWQPGCTALLDFTGMSLVNLITQLNVRSCSPEHPAIKQTCNSLLSMLHKLPTEGQCYSGIHLAWRFVIACICTQAQEDDWLVTCLDPIGGDKSVS